MTPHNSSHEKGGAYVRNGMPYESLMSIFSMSPLFYANIVVTFECGLN
jgi:hypothetical protein